MKLDTFIRNHPALNYAQDLKTICQPILEAGIVYFSHAHIDDQFNLSGLCSHPEFFKLYVKKGYYNYDLHMAAVKGKEQYILGDTIQRKKQTKNLHDDFMSFNQSHTFSIILNNDNSKDCYHFAARLGDTSINEKYLQNIDSLKKFILHFKDKVANSKALSAAYKQKLILAKNEGGFFTQETSKLKIEKLTDKINVERIHVHGRENYITTRELECLHWMALGKTAEETAMILEISIRTVKAHIANIKNKLGCYNQFQLGMFYEKMKSFIG